MTDNLKSNDCKKTNWYKYKVISDYYNVFGNKQVAKSVEDKQLVEMASEKLNYRS